MSDGGWKASAIEIVNRRRPMKDYMKWFLGQGLVLTHFDEPAPTGGPSECGESRSLALGPWPLYIRPRMTIDHDSRLRRLRFRAWHRGFREADLILGPFADIHGPKLTLDQFDTFETLLEESDREIYAWIVGQEPTPDVFETDVMSMIRAFRFEAHASRPVGDGA